MRTLLSVPRFVTVFGETLRHARRAQRRDPDTLETLHPIMRDWASRVLELLRVQVSVEGTPHPTPSLLVGNHMSYLDIPLLMAATPVVFVAKDELSRWPVIGTACRSVGTVFVQRESRDSRRDAQKAVASAIFDRGQSVCLFPSGTTTLDEDKPWRWGAFEIARQFNIPVQPFRLSYRPLRRVAFLKEDALVPHLLALLGEERIEASLEFHPPVEITSVEADCERWRRWTQEGPGVPSLSPGLETPTRPTLEGCPAT